MASSPPPWPEPELALELFQNGRVFQRGRVLRQFLALGQTTQQTAHDLAGTGLRQVVAETDVLRLGDGSDLVANPLVAEAAVVGRPDDLTGEAIVAFVVLKGARPADADAAKKIAKELSDWVGKEIGPIAKPKDIRFGDNLPKTRSGKIMRRLLRGLAKGEELTQDTSTLENPAILEQLKNSI